MDRMTSARAERPGPGIRWLPCVLALFIVAGTGCSDILGLGDDGLLPNLRKWRTERPAFYQFTYQRVCFCAGTEPVIISVDGDSVTHVSLESGEGPPPALPSEYPTVDGLFEQLIEWRERDPHRERMEFHDRLGYPTDVFFDFREHVADEEMGFRVTDLRALERLEN